MVLLTEQIIRGKTRLDRLDEVKNLNLWGQDLSDVSILAMMPNVEVLSLSLNHIPSLRDFRHCAKLQELYLRKNYISDITDIQYLAQLPDLRVLWLCENPCADHPLYRQIVARMLPSVEKLDNVEFTPQDREAAARNPQVDRALSGVFPPLPATPGEPAAARPEPCPSPPLPPSPPRPLSRQASAAPTPAPAYGRISPARPHQEPPPQEPYGASPAGRARTPPQAGMMANGHGDPLANAQRRKKNILYAVMALVAELDAEDLMFVKREAEERLGAMGR